MANGVPESEVFKAADTVLARGERPIVERVSIELGRGSPARVGQLLEQWWEQLAQRLKGHALLPEFPGEVAQAFTETWRVALTHAGAAAQAALSEERIRLVAMGTSLTQERKLWEIGLAAAQADLAEVSTKLAQADLQLAERQALVEEMTAQNADIRHQREHLQGQLVRQHAETEALRAEYAAAQIHIRAAEGRAHLQVDQLRQELRVLQQQRERDARDHERRSSTHWSRR